MPCLESVYVQHWVSLEELKRQRASRRWHFVLEGNWASGKKPEGDPGCCRLQNSRMTFSRMLPPACHWNTVWLIKVSVALNFHWHSTPRATLGALRQAIHTQGKMEDIRKEAERRGNSLTRGQPLEDSTADPSNNTESQWLSINTQEKGYILECKSTLTNMHAPRVFYISSVMVCPSE